MNSNATRECWCAWGFSFFSQLSIFLQLLEWNNPLDTNRILLDNWYKWCTGTLQRGLEIATHSMLRDPNWPSIGTAICTHFGIGRKSSPVLTGGWTCWGHSEHRAVPSCLFLNFVIYRSRHPSSFNRHLKTWLLRLSPSNLPPSLLGAPSWRDILRQSRFWDSCDMPWILSGPILIL